MKNVLVTLVFLVIFSCATSKATKEHSLSEMTIEMSNNERPKLVIGIVVDQMRYDYLTRFYNKYGNNGFKRLMTKGYNLKNNHYNYIPTYTGPGHAAIFTGATPKNNGIIANYWYDKLLDEMVYCASDKTVNSVGTNDEAGKMSPKRMLTTTFGDENRLFTQFKGKTIGISIKDRGAILPAGHTANAAYWFHGKKEGRFITSDFYMQDLPEWVKTFNASGTVKSYLKEWNTLFPIATYTESGRDLNNFESSFEGKEQAVFPYDLKSLANKNDGFDIIKATPFGNSLVTDFAISAIKNEYLGKDDVTDILTVSFSSTDYVGHTFGVNSKEIEDTYIRLDRDLARLLNVLDTEVGENNYTLFLTSDHGAVEVPSYLSSKKIPSGYISTSEIKEQVDSLLVDRYNGVKGLVKNVSNNQIFLDTKRIQEMNLIINEVEEYIVSNIISNQYINIAFTSQTMRSTQFTNGEAALLQMGYNQKYSGNVIYSLKPSYISYSKTGSTHGSGLNYDTHVPLLFYGHGIKKGETLKKTVITSVAPTVSALLGISFPNGSSSEILEFVIEKE